MSKLTQPLTVQAQKEAVTDGIKRALKHFGNVLGNCLYDREFTKEIAKVRVGPVSALLRASLTEGQVQCRGPGAPAGVHAARCSSPGCLRRPTTCLGKPQAASTRARTPATVRSHSRAHSSLCARGHAPPLH